VIIDVNTEPVFILPPKSFL